MVTIRHPSVHVADSAGTGAVNDVIGLAAAAIREVLAQADIAPSDPSILVIAASGEPAGRDPAELAVENSFADRLVRELVWETGLLNAVPILVGLLGEPVLTTGVLTAHGLLMAERLGHAMVVVINLGEPGAVGAAAFLICAGDGDGLLIRHLDVITPRSDDHAHDRPEESASTDAIIGLRATLLGANEQELKAHRMSSPAPDAGLVELLLRSRDPIVQGVLETMQTINETTMALGDRAVLIEGSAFGLGGVMLERLQQ